MESRPIQSILVPIEFSEFSEPEVDYAIGLARQLEARLLLFGVIDRASMLTLIGKARGSSKAASKEASADVGGGKVERRTDQGTLNDTLVDEAGQILQTIVDRAAEVGVAARGHAIVSEHVADQIHAEAERQEVDLILVHAKPRSLFSRAFFGNTVEDVLHKAPCPVLVSNA